MSSRELKTSIFTHVLRTRENSDASNTLDEIYLVFTKKKVNILYIYATLLWTSFHNVTKICIPVVNLLILTHLAYIANG